ncbi:MAG: hypothetical protein CBD37_01295 [Cyanobacteria bacterium TMED177]|nr:MAG: hypothetical protein CBD37_01295 [Cyanobacteria bacterium TMED177]
MRRWMPTLMSLGPPLLIVLALMAAQQRQGRDRVQALMPALVGSGLIISCAVGRRRHRSRLLAALRNGEQSQP